ncbi:four helix bundle protein [bacterium]|nr:four helix bundle protein [bacterium]
MSEKKNIIREKSYSFALRVIKLYQHLSKDKKEFVLSKQILRSGTAIGAMVEEALQAESKADFLHKISMANKEANETFYWLRLLKDSGFIISNAANSIIHDSNEIRKILSSIVFSTKRTLKK